MYNSQIDNVSSTPSFSIYSNHATDTTFDNYYQYISQYNGNTANNVSMTNAPKNLLTTSVVNRECDSPYSGTSPQVESYEHLLTGYTNQFQNDYYNEANNYYQRYLTATPTAASQDYSQYNRTYSQYYNSPFIYHPYPASRTPYEYDIHSISNNDTSIATSSSFVSSNNTSTNTSSLECSPVISTNVPIKSSGSSTMIRNVAIIEPHPAKAQVKQTPQQSNYNQYHQQQHRQAEQIVIPTRRGRVSSHNHQLPEEAVTILNAWFESHVNNPYPTTEEKHRLAAECNITTKQVNSWFCNRRNRSQNTKPKRIRRQLEEEIKNVFHQLASNSIQNPTEAFEKLKNTLRVHEIHIDKNKN